MARRIIIHIGTHKTGTTSLQALLHENSREIKEQGFEYYEGTLSKKNHYDLNLAVMRGGVETFANYHRPLLNQAETYNAVRNKIADQMRRSTAHTFIFSNEDLSYLRTKGECELLRGLFSERGLIFKILLVIREKDDFLRSYKSQMLKKPGREPATDRTSGFYVERDTWLVDYERLKDAYRSVFEDVVVFDYVEEGLLSALLAEMNLQLKVDANKYRWNASHPGVGRAGVGRLLDRVRKLLLKD